MKSDLSFLNLIVALTVAFLLSNISVLLLLGKGGDMKTTVAGMFETFAQSIGDSDSATTNFVRSEQQIDVSAGVRAPSDFDSAPNVYPMVARPAAFPEPLNAVNSGEYASSSWENDSNNIYKKKARKEPEGIPASYGGKNQFNFHVY